MTLLNTQYPAAHHRQCVGQAFIFPAFCRRTRCSTATPLCRLFDTVCASTYLSAFVVNFAVLGPLLLYANVGFPAHYLRTLRFLCSRSHLPDTQTSLAAWAATASTRLSPTSCKPCTTPHAFSAFGVRTVSTRSYLWFISRHMCWA